MKKQLCVYDKKKTNNKDRYTEVNHRKMAFVLLGWNEYGGMARVSIAEIRNPVRLINMGFYPLFKEISKEVEDINIHADAVFDIVMRVNKKANAPTSIKENNAS